VTINFNKQIIEKHGLSIGEFLYLIGKINKIEPYQLIENSLVLKGLISPEYHDNKPSGYFVMNNAKELISNIIAESENTNEQQDLQLQELAQTLKEVFPKGAKEGSGGLQWAGSKQLIVNRLKLFFKRYGKFTNEEIINAAQAYVNSFNGNYRYMQILKYFIFKDKRTDTGMIDCESQLLTYIENYENIEELRCDWTSQIK
jgi:hypothetical protein